MLQTHQFVVEILMRYSQPENWRILWGKDAWTIDLVHTHSTKVFSAPLLSCIASFMQISSSSTHNAFHCFSNSSIFVFPNRPRNSYGKFITKLWLFALSYNSKDCLRNGYWDKSKLVLGVSLRSIFLYQRTKKRRVTMESLKF